MFVDSSVLLNVLDVPGMNSDSGRLIAEFKPLAQAGVTLVIPTAAVIEVGNHIAQLPVGGARRDRAVLFVRLLRSAVQRQAPWVIAGASWDEDFLARVVDGHAQLPGLVDLCTSGVGSGDASILAELQHYRERSDLPSALPVRLWTLDASLQAYS